MKLKKDDGEINLATGEADPEFAEWKWASPEEVIEQVCYKNMTCNKYLFFSVRKTNRGANNQLQAVDYKRPTYEEVVTTFKPYFEGNAISAKCKSTKW